MKNDTKTEQNHAIENAKGHIATIVELVAALRQAEEINTIRAKTIYRIQK